MLAIEPLSFMEFARCWSKSAHLRSSERTAEEQRDLGNGCWVMDFIGDTRLCVVRSIICWRLGTVCWRGLIGLGIAVPGFVDQSGLNNCRQTVAIGLRSTGPGSQRSSAWLNGRVYGLLSGTSKIELFSEKTVCFDFSTGNSSAQSILNLKPSSFHHGLSKCHDHIPGHTTFVL